MPVIDIYGTKIYSSPFPSAERYQAITKYSADYQDMIISLRPLLLTWINFNPSMDK